MKNNHLFFSACDFFTPVRTVNQNYCFSFLSQAAESSLKSPILALLVFFLSGQKRLDGGIYKETINQRQKEELIKYIRSLLLLDSSYLKQNSIYAHSLTNLLQVVRSEDGHQILPFSSLPRGDVRENGVGIKDFVYVLFPESVVE